LIGSRVTTAQLPSIQLCEQRRSANKSKELSYKLPKSFLIVTFRASENR